MDRSLFLTAAAAVVYATTVAAWFFVTQMAIGKRVRGPFPLSTVVILVVTTGITALQFLNDEVLPSLERHPGDLQHWRLWKLFTPLFVQGDGWDGMLFNTLAFLFVAFTAERVYGRRRMLLMYFIPGLIGQLFGFWWTDHGAGNSVAIAGLIGGFWVVELVYTHRLPSIAPQLAWVGIGTAVVLTLLGEMHGPAFLVGAAMGYVLDRVSPMLPHHADPAAARSAS